MSVEVNVLTTNPYLDDLRGKAQKMRSFKDFDDFSLLMDYVDNVQIKAMASGGTVSLEEEEVPETRNIAGVPNSELSPEEMMAKMREDFFKEMGEDDDEEDPLVDV